MPSRDTRGRRPPDGRPFVRPSSPVVRARSSRNLALLRARGAQLISLGRLGERASVTTAAPPPATPFPSPDFPKDSALVTGGVTGAFSGLGGAPWPVEGRELEINFAHEKERPRELEKRSGAVARCPAQATRSSAKVRKRLTTVTPCFPLEHCERSSRLGAGARPAVGRCSSRDVLAAPL